MYYDYQQNQAKIASANTTLGIYPDRTQLYSRISSSKTTVTEVTEKSSLWESSTAISRAPTSFVSFLKKKCSFFDLIVIIYFRMLLTKSAGTVALSDLEQNKQLMTIPEFSLENYQRPENNLIHLSADQNTDEIDQILISSMFFGKEKSST